MPCNRKIHLRKIHERKTMNLAYKNLLNIHCQKKTLFIITSFLYKIVLFIFKSRKTLYSFKSQNPRKKTLHNNLKILKQK